jgi:hypothetical protein
VKVQKEFNPKRLNVSINKKKRRNKMYSKPEVNKLSSAVNAIQQQTISTPKGSPFFADKFQNDEPTSTLTLNAYESDE